MSIRSKILVPMVVMAVACSLTICVIAISVVKSFTNDFNDELLLHASTLASASMEQYSEDAARLSLLVATDDHIIDTLTTYNSSGSRDELVSAVVPMLGSTSVDFITILDNNGDVIVRAHEPDNFGDSLANQKNIQMAMGGSQYTTTEKGTAVKLSVRSGTPIFDSSGKQIGLVSLGYRFDQPRFVDYVKRISGTEVAVFLGDSRISTTVAGDVDGRAIGTQAAESVSSQVLAGKEFIGRTSSDGGFGLYSHYMPISDSEGNILGMLAVGLDTSPTDSRIAMDTWITAGFMVLLTAVSGLISLRVSSRIVKPIRDIALAAERLAKGEVDVEITVSDDRDSKDETVHLARAFADMIETNHEREKIIKDMSEGDFSGHIVPKSKKDLIGVALEHLLERNNHAFGEMNQMATQLDIASNQMSDGSQSLSQSASEQAATVDILKTQLQTLSERTTSEADHAKQAAKLSDNVKNLAEKGNEQMNHMMDAVEQISKASEAIEKVIKVIDDIAFQTNILALNAAVEAARAGQHGKGFAVVSEEVRNLASKSAEAAKDTGVLIANSIEKAKLGAQISADTATSFAEIVGGVKESTVIVDEIADFMQAQRSEIENIVNGVDEIGRIVTSVSASAEQSAASSEEMSSQAAIMASTLSAYRLKNIG